MFKSVMIVDDSATMRLITRKFLETSGFNIGRIEEAASGAEALEKLAKEPVELVLCDMNMPEMNGVELVKKIRGEIKGGGDIKIIMISAEDSEEYVREITAAGADGHITKPFNAKKLLNGIAANIKSRQVEI